MSTETDGGIQAVKAAQTKHSGARNERIRLVAETSEHMEFLCECPDLDCTETLKRTTITPSSRRG
jgi:hypothetical protein